MAQDIRDLLKEEQQVSIDKMPIGHQDRFMQKLERELPETRSQGFRWFNIAASVVVLLGLSFGAYKFYQPEVVIDNPQTDIVTTKTLGDISPDLKTVEDYYLASINLELSKIKYTPETKELFDGYIERLNELNKEYERLSLELTNSGPNELTVNALIDNLKFRLNLLYRLKDQLKELNTSNQKEVQQSI